MAPLFDLVLRHVPPPHGRGRPVPHARHHPRSQPLPRPHPHRPHLLRLGQAEPAGQGARPRRQADRAGPRLQGAGLPRARAPPIDEAEAGDIVAIAGLPEATVADTICEPEVDEPLPAQPIDPPTLAMTFRVNDSPLAGTEGDKVHEPRHPRPPAARGRRQRRAARHANPTRRIRSKSPAAANCSSAS